MSRKDLGSVFTEKCAVRNAEFDGFSKNGSKEGSILEEKKWVALKCPSLQWVVWEDLKVFWLFN